MNYTFLQSVTSPRHMKIAISLLGTHEIPGIKSNPVIMGWAKSLGLDDIYKNDDTAWCGLFFCHVMNLAGRKVVLETTDKFDYLRALKLILAPALQTVATEDIAFGDIVGFRRPEGGHIAFAVGTDAKTIHCIGGNQSNSVSVTRIEKTRIEAAKRIAYISYQPQIITLTANGTISSNEA